MTLRIGILGAARVATYAMIGAARDVAGVTVQAVAARDPARARAYADKYGIARVYPDYQTLIEADDVDAVYVALPPNLHARWSIAALAAGKPVLCEKPFALNVADVEAMLAAEAAHGALLMEAQHSYYHPINVRARALVADGAIGAVRSAIACFNADIPRVEGEIRWDGTVGGGAIWDLGIYPAWWLRGLLGEGRVVRAAQQCSASGADIWTRAELRYDGDVPATLMTDMVGPRTAWLQAAGEHATLIIDNPLSANFPQRLTLVRNGEFATEEFTRRTSFAFQLDAFRDAVQDGAPVATGGAESLAIIRQISDICALAQGE